MKSLWKLLCGVLLLVPGLAVFGQQTTGEVTGTVADSSGAVIEGATVTATDLATQQVRTTSSSSTGNFVLPYLVPGNYSVKCEKAGFKMDSVPSLEVTVGAVLRSDFRMEVGAVTQQVEVSTAAPLLATESTSVQTNIGSHQIVSLPLNGRDYLQLVALTPNVVNEAQSTGGGGLMGGVRASESIAVAGQRLEFNHYTLDGVENTDPDFNSYIIHPSVDALQEFTVLTGVYSAEFGRGAGQINANTLPGTNAYHAVAYYFLRNDAVDAKLWHQVGNKNPFHRNDYGFTLDGPLSIPRVYSGRDRMFFASSFEDLTDHKFLQEFGSVPTAAMRQGDFSAFPVGTKASNPSGCGGPVPCIPQMYNPSTRTATGATPISNNNLTTVSGFTPSSQAVAMMNYFYPLPTGCTSSSAATCTGIGNGSYANDYVAEVLQPTQSTQFNQRVDWTQNQKSNWFGRFSWENDLSGQATVFPNADSAQVQTTVRQAVIGNTLTIGQHVVNDARFAWNQFNNSYAGYYYNSSTDVQANLGIQGLTSTNGAVTYGVPALGFSGNAGITGGGGVTPWITYDDLFQWMDNVSIIKGNHVFKAGGMFERDRFNNFGNQKSEGEFDFDSQSTDDPGCPSDPNCPAGVTSAIWATKPITSIAISS